MKKRAQRTEREKAKIVLESLKERSTLSELSRKYSVNVNLISKWRKLFLTECHTLFSRSSKVLNQKEEHDLELERLYAQIGKLQVENEYLKKTLIST